MRVPPLVLGLCGVVAGIVFAWFVYGALNTFPTRTAIQSVPPETQPVTQRPEEASSTSTTTSSHELEPVEHVVTTTELQIADVPPSPAFVPSASSTSGTQYIVLAFDGSRSIDMWKQTRAFAKDMAAKHAPVHFTYFINTAYLLAQANRNFYKPPQHATGTSPIGFATSERDVANRLEQMNAVIQEGHEIGCHLTGHYNGATWSEADWAQEFKSFFDILAQVGTINHLEQEPAERRALALPPEGIVGFRAPELGVNKHLWPVLTQHHFQYDTSLTAKPGVWPRKLPSGLWEFPLTKIPFAGSATSSLLSMDYNFYFKQSHAVDTAVRGTPLWNQYYNEVLTSYRDYFKQSYQGNHAPLFIGHHFSLWNDGVYWEAMKTFATEVCGLPDVRCLSYKEVMESLQSQP